MKYLLPLRALPMLLFLSACSMHTPMSLPERTMVYVCADVQDRDRTCNSSMSYVCNGKSTAVSGTVTYSTFNSTGSERFHVPPQARIGSGAHRLGYEMFSPHGGSCFNRNFSLREN